MSGDLLRFRFRKNRRLRHRADFNRVRNQGITVRGRFFTVGAFIESPETNSRLGVITTRQCGKAVARSAIRRLIRELFRTRQHEFLKCADIVVIPKATAMRAEKKMLREELLHLWKKAGL